MAGRRPGGAGRHRRWHAGGRRPARDGDARREGRPGGGAGQRRVQAGADRRQARPAGQARLRRAGLADHVAGVVDRGPRSPRHRGGGRRRHVREEPCHRTPRGLSPTPRADRGRDPAQRRHPAAARHRRAAGGDRAEGRWRPAAQADDAARDGAAARRRRRRGRGAARRHRPALGLRHAGAAVLRGARRADDRERPVVGNPSDSWQEASRTLSYAVVFGVAMAFARFAPQRWAACSVEPSSPRRSSAATRC